MRSIERIGATAALIVFENIIGACKAVNTKKIEHPRIEMQFYSANLNSDMQYHPDEGKWSVKKRPSVSRGSKSTLRTKSTYVKGVMGYNSRDDI